MNALTHRHRWDIFCRVIDNFGDIGVSWRLARQLAADHGLTVRLWVDNISCLHALCPEVDPHLQQQQVSGVAIFQDVAAMTCSHCAEVVVEVFGCGLPKNYLDAMPSAPAKPLWIVLEYLSAEPWVSSHHGLPSPHPHLDVPRYFFFPGFAEDAGGLLREADLLDRRAAFGKRQRRAFWRMRGFDDVTPETTTVSLFAYPHAPYREWLDACIDSGAPVVVSIPEGALARCVRDDYQTGGGKLWRKGQLELRFVPFVRQEDFDKLLWACDINFVRGEDSIVRALWAGKAFVWHIYSQGENAHVEKLDAFLRRYQDWLEPHAGAAVQDFWHAWNNVENAPPIADAWRTFMAARNAQQHGLGQWQNTLLHAGSCTDRLLNFCQKVI